MSSPDSDARYSRHFESSCEDIATKLGELGPGLVSNFAAEGSFVESMDVSFLGRDCKPITKKLGEHSMVLVGSCKSNDGRYVFLLQNFWESRYFIEVSGEYLVKTNASIYFVSRETPIKEIPSQFTGDYIVYAETLLDAGERTNNEW